GKGSRRVGARAVILALVEHDRGQLDPLSFEMLTFGRRLARNLNAPLEAVLIGKEAPSLVEELSGQGVSTMHLLEHARLDEYAPEAWAESVTQLMAASGPQVVMAAGSDRGNELMAHIAPHKDLPMAANRTD